MTTLDRRRVHTFRQSWLNDAELCDERGRRQLAGTYPRIETDAAAIGTAVHAGAEHMLLRWLESGERSPLSERLTALTVAHDEFARIASLDNFEWKKYDRKTADELIAVHLNNWITHILPTLGEPLYVEWNFDVPFYEDDERIIRLSGTADYVQRDYKIVDWKTAGRPYNVREKQDNAIQPSAYTFALAHTYALHNEDRPWYFDYGVMIHPSSKTGKGADARWETVPVIRHRDHWQWLREKCLTWAVQIEAGLPTWALKDNGWWCSEKWCAVYDQCRGAVAPK